jgi:hypothetical protein
MSKRLFAIPGYVHLYRSLLRFCKLGIGEARELVYCLNTANLDSCRLLCPDAALSEMTAFRFNRRLDGGERPYRTEIQLHKALKTLNRSIRYEALISQQREAVQQMKRVMSNLAFNFYTVFDMEIDSPATVCRHCRNHLIPFEDEPSVCLYEDWVLLPTA